MGSNDKLIKVIDSEDQVLFECGLEEEDKAFDFARQMEEIGIEVKISSPSLPETLIISLGATQKDKDILRKELVEEIEEHDSGCCFDIDNSNKTIH